FIRAPHTSALFPYTTLFRSHGLATGGESGEDHRLVWVARSDDAGATLGGEQPAWREPTGACGCCGLRLFSAAPNNLFLLYRSATDRKSTRLNSSHEWISYAV